MSQPIPMGLYVIMSNGRIIKLRSRVCPECGDAITQHALDRGDCSIFRIGGDSANGYEAIHMRCYGAVPPSGYLTPTAADADDDDL